jgi:lysine-specific demethylase 8
VPIELGKRYTDDNWTQKLMTIQDFVEKYIQTDKNGVGYLAQYQLFDQVYKTLGKNSLRII